eukprot:TRINITY_DN6428_c0_g1_i2.p1 TRINITY_DN6428_c0_g1~~TRINITY_DN6428_c0_g1_i2.p1  ORF type:complete len:262 (+),score=69.17 TRINITY_DN6428_c0_g1_i2:58-843(+)
MPQNEHIERHTKLYGKRFDAEERARKKEARSNVERAAFLSKCKGLRAKLQHKARHKEKVELKRKIKEHEEKQAGAKPKEKPAPKNAVPAFLEDRAIADRAKLLTNSIKQKRKEKVGKWAVPVPKVKPMTEDEMFKVVRTGNTRRKSWKRMIHKFSFVGEAYTRKPPKYERFIRPMSLRMKKAHVTHPQLAATFHLPIIGVKKNPQSRMYTTLGIITKGSILEVNVSELGLVTPGGKVVWGKYAQVTNNPENDGVINAVLLV